MFPFNPILFFFSSLRHIFFLTLFPTPMCTDAYTASLRVSMYVADTHKKSMSCLFDVLLSYSSMPSREGNAFYESIVRFFFRSFFSSIIGGGLFDEHARRENSSNSIFFLLSCTPPSHLFEPRMSSSCRYTKKKKKKPD